MQGSDGELLGAYLSHRSEAAFAELVRRHIDLVYASALRQLGGDEELARDAVQDVFVDLARKAHSLSARSSLTGWLYTSARFAAVNLLRSEQRRRVREQEAEQMKADQSSPGLETGWDQLRPVLDEAMAQLDEPDREALLLRFFQKRELKEVGSALGISDEAARKRVDRALGKLRNVLRQRGVNSTSVALGTGLISASVMTAPNGLAAAVTSAALGATATTITTATVMTLANMKIGIVAAVAVVGLGTTALIQRHVNIGLRNENEALRSAAEGWAMSAAPATLGVQSANQENSETGFLLARNVSLSNEVHRLQTRLALLEQQARRTPGEARLDPEPQAEDPARQLALAALQGDPTALEKLAELTKAACIDEHAVEKLRPIWSAFHLFVEEAGMEKENALRVLAQAARMPSLKSLAVKSLGELAGAGSEGALNVILDPGKFGIQPLLSDTVEALRPVAEAGNPRAIEALAAVAADERQQPLWYMAADALGKAAASGNETAIDALISFSSSTNQSVRTAALAGLNAAAATQNQKAVEAVRQLQSNQP